MAVKKVVSFSLTFLIFSASRPDRILGGRRLPRTAKSWSSPGFGRRRLPRTAKSWPGTPPRPQEYHFRDSRAAESEKSFSLWRITFSTFSGPPTFFHSNFSLDQKLENQLLFTAMPWHSLTALQTLLPGQTMPAGIARDGLWWR